jgi:hypothetical protein
VSKIREKVLASLPTCPIPEIKRLGKTLKQWREAFLAYFDTGRANNGGTEAINGLIELHRRVARGFRNREHYRLRMLPDARIEEDFAELLRVGELLEAERLRRLAELERRRVFEGDGYLSAAAWLVGRFRVAPGAARVHARVARALGEMPRTRHALEEARSRCRRSACWSRRARPIRRRSRVRRRTWSRPLGSTRSATCSA